MKNSVLLTLSSSLLLGVSFLTAADSDVPLKNPGFEGSFGQMAVSADDAKAKINGQLAADWQDNSDWANIAVDYSVDSEEAHGGNTAQKVAVTRVTEGVVQLKQSVTFVADREYTFTVWLRGDSDSKVALALRQAIAPYTTYKEEIVTLAPEWREYSVTGTVSDDTDGFVMIIANAPVTYSIDDADLKESSR